MAPSRSRTPSRAARATCCPTRAPIIFTNNVYTNAAGGTLEYLGDGSNASTETVGAAHRHHRRGHRHADRRAPAAPPASSSLRSARRRPGPARASISSMPAARHHLLHRQSRRRHPQRPDLFFNGADFAYSAPVRRPCVHRSTAPTPSSALRTRSRRTHMPYLTADIATASIRHINDGSSCSDNAQSHPRRGPDPDPQQRRQPVRAASSSSAAARHHQRRHGHHHRRQRRALVFRVEGASSDPHPLHPDPQHHHRRPRPSSAAAPSILGAANAKHRHTSTSTKAPSGSPPAATLGAANHRRRTSARAPPSTSTASARHRQPPASGSPSTARAWSPTAAPAPPPPCDRQRQRCQQLLHRPIQDGAGQISTGQERHAARIHLSDLNTFSGPVHAHAAATSTSPGLANIGQASGIGTGDATSDATNAASLVFNGGVLRYIGTNATVYRPPNRPRSASTACSPWPATAPSIPTAATATSIAPALGQQRRPHLQQHRPGRLQRNRRPDAAPCAAIPSATTRSRLQLIDNPNAGEALTLNKADGGLWILSNAGQLLHRPDPDRRRRAPRRRWHALSHRQQPAPERQRRPPDLRHLRPRHRHRRRTRCSGTRTSSGGFAASTDRLIVNLGGAGATLNWGTGGIGNGTGRLILSSTTAWADVDFQNGINLNGANRTVTVNDNGNTGLDYRHPLRRHQQQHRHRRPHQERRRHPHPRRCQHLQRRYTSSRTAR